MKILELLGMAKNLLGFFNIATTVSFIELATTCNHEATYQATVDLLSVIAAIFTSSRIA